PNKPIAILSALLLVFVLLECLVPLLTAIQIGADEGFELTKATLSVKGHKFYTEAWNDQPLLHTSLITQVLKHLSPAVLGPRLVTPAFALVLLASVFLISHRISGLLAAILATTLLIASPGFLELGSSCMVEIPGLAPAVAGLCVLLAGRQSKLRVPEILAGVLFAVALQIKLIGVIYLPLAGLVLWLRQREASASRSRPAATPTYRTGGGCREMRASSSVRLIPKELVGPALFFAASLSVSFVAIHLL